MTTHRDSQFNTALSGPRAGKHKPATESVLFTVVAVGLCLVLALTAVAAMSRISGGGQVVAQGFAFQGAPASAY